MDIRVTTAVHRIVGGFLSAGATAVDATAGNGHDTLFLARAVGSGGRVLAMDIQPEAIDSTRERLAGEGAADRVRLVLDSHERLRKYAAELPDAPAVVMFNLGYLPGGSDASTTTRTASTVLAVRAALDIVDSGGIVSIVCYPGHDGGAEETEAVLRMTDALDAKRFAAATYKSLNPEGSPPVAVFLQRRPQ